MASSCIVNCFDDVLASQFSVCTTQHFKLNTNGSDHTHKDVPTQCTFLTLYFSIA